MSRDSQLMKTYWDSKARENATYYVSSYRPYDEQNWEEFWKWGDILAERFLGESDIPFDGSEKVLEIGCGIGRMTRYFARRFKEVHGIDVAPEMISRARKNLNEFENRACMSVMDMISAVLMMALLISCSLTSRFSTFRVCPLLSSTFTRRVVSLKQVDISIFK